MFFGNLQKVKIYFLVPSGLLKQSNRQKTRQQFVRRDIEGHKAYNDRQMRRTD
jgi:hypothetical protein